MRGDFVTGTDYAAGTDSTANTHSTARAVPVLPSPLNRALLAVVRIGVGLLWLQMWAGKRRRISVGVIRRTGCTYRQVMPFLPRYCRRSPG